MKRGLLGVGRGPSDLESIRAGMADTPEPTGTNELHQHGAAIVHPLRSLSVLARVLVFCCLLTAGSCDMRPAVRSVAEEIRIDRDWSEIRPDPPLEVSKQVQRISIDVPDVADWDIRPESGSFVTPDGTAVKIDVELVATDGTRFGLDSIGLGPGLTFSYLPPDADETGSRLPPDMKFTTIRLRSDVPLEGGRVSWICITNY